MKRTHWIPYASPLLLTNHSSMKRMVGEYARLAPMAYAIPCEIRRCVVFVAKELNARAVHMIRNPRGVAHSFSRGTASRSAKTNGERIYIIPYKNYVRKWEVMDRKMRGTNHSTRPNSSDVSRVLKRLMSAVIFLEDTECECESCKHS